MLLKKKRSARYFNARDSLRGEGAFSKAPISSLLIFLCCLFFIAELADKQRILAQLFSISKYLYIREKPYTFLPEVSTGELWRLVTPIFLHGGLLHLFFNMAWLYKLGSSIEQRVAKLNYISLILFTAIIPNLAFYILISPLFRGASGVIYGLMGYMWAIDKCSMNSPYSQEKELINAIAIIYVVCWLLTAFQIMPIANTIHGFGAFTGLLFGLLHARIQGDQYSGDGSKTQMKGLILSLF